MYINLKNEKETALLGKITGKHLKGGDLLTLIGDLGAGKTLVTKNIAKELGVKDDITSPTFTIVNEYEIEDNSEVCGLNHFDVYRIGCEDEMYDIGFDEYMESGRVNIIEWADLIEGILPQERLELSLKYSLDGRVAEFNPKSSYYSKKADEILKELKENNIEVME